MAKHDQRILKFLNQNADRAPTITDMMTRLNISISDISDSLGSLLAQGLVAKRTNNQGIECWFPVASAPQSAQNAAPTQQMPAQQQMPQPQLSAAQLVGEIRSSSESRPLVEARQMDSRYMGGVAERPMSLPEAQPPMAKPAPVHVQHIPMAERSATQTQSFQAMSSLSSPANPANAANEIFGATSAGASSPASAPSFNFSQPANKGIGFLTFAVGLVVAVGASTWLAGRLASNEIHRAQKSFVDQKALTDANAAFLDFQGKTKTHITALEEEVKKLSDQLATSKAAAESLKVAAAAPPAKGAAVKGAPAKAEEGTAKTKAGKKAQIAKASKTAALLAKATATPHKKKKASAHGAPKTEYYDSTPSDENSASASSAASAPDAAPSVPQAPGLDNQDLPPPSE